jgi:hypothetical protein
MVVFVYWKCLHTISSIFLSKNFALLLPEVLCGSTLRRLCPRYHRISRKHSKYYPKAFKILPESIQNTTQRSKLRHGDLRNYALMNGIKFISDDDDAITNIRETWAGACFFTLPHASDISAMHVHNYVYVYSIVPRHVEGA